MEEKKEMERMDEWKELENHLLLRKPFDLTVKKDVQTTSSEILFINQFQKFVNDVVLGNYLNVISHFKGSTLELSNLIESLLTEDDLFMAMKSFLLCHLEDDSDGHTIRTRTFETLLLGVTLFELYCQCNYTGPEFNRKDREILDTKTEEERKVALDGLECDGCFGHHTVDMPHLLLFSRLILGLLNDPTRAFWKKGIKLSPDGHILAPTLEIFDQFRHELISTFSEFPSIAWWTSRTCTFHTRVLLNESFENIPTLWNETTFTFKKALVSFGAADSSYDLSVANAEPIYSKEILISSNLYERILASEIWLEWGLACHHFGFGDKGKKKFQIAKEIMKLDIYLTAALGKRVKYQREDIAQLYLYAKSDILPKLNASDYQLIPISSQPNAIGNKKTSNSREQEQQPEEEKKEIVVREGDNPDEFEIGKRTVQETTAGEEVAVREVLLDQVNTGLAENVILEGGPKFQSVEEINFGGDLHPLDQIIILALCLDVSNSNPIDGLTNEEMLPYIEKVVNAPLNWMIHSTALLERSWIEFERRKTADRAMLQIQALIDQHSTKLTITQASYKSIEESAKNYERIFYLYQMIYPSQFEMKKDLAMKYLRCQVFMSALLYFKELQMWDEVVTCYQLMNKPHKAEMIVREQLKINETPYMITSLADLTGNEELYERAWTISNHRYPRAKRTLGKICYDRGDFQKCVEHLTAALSVQPLIHTAWYLKGIACMRLEWWDEGITCFVRCVQLENELAEAWTNLGAIYMRQKEWMKAYHSLTEAMKSKNDDYRVLENMLTVTLQLRKWKESILQMNRLLDLRFKSQQDKPLHFKELRFLCKLLPFLYWKYLESDPLILNLDEEQELLQGSHSHHEQQQQKQQQQEDAVVVTEYEADLALPAVPSLMGTDEDEGESSSSAPPPSATATSSVAPPLSPDNVNIQKKLQEVELLRIRYEKLINDFDKLLNKIVLNLRSDPDVNDIIAEWNYYLRKYRESYEYRVKQVRAVFNEAGWEKKEEKVKALVFACDRLRDALKSSEYQSELKKEDHFSSKMLIQSCIRKLDKDEPFSPAAEEALKQIVSQLE